MNGPLLLTGATGWFGRTALHEYEREHGPEALRRDVIPLASRQQMVDFESPHGPVQAYPLDVISEVKNPRGLLHLAFLTRDKVDELGWQLYVERNRAITAKVADLVRAWPSMPVVATSSGAAAALDGREPDLQGNPYATLKQEEEALLQSEAATRMAVVFRVYAATGRFMTRPENFALGDFILQALKGGPIVLRNPALVRRSYVNIGLLMQASWKLLLGPQAPCFLRLDACSHTITLPDLASVVASLYAVEWVHEERLISLPSSDTYVGTSFEMSAMLARLAIPTLSLDQEIRETAIGLGQRI